MVRRSKLTLERLKEAFEYNPDTGTFTWRIKKGVAFPGKVVNVLANNESQPYIYVCLDGERHYAHRVAWFYMKGEWPPAKIDHRNGVHNDNRWTNLRLSTNSQNQQNARLRKDNTSGFKGVSFDKGRGKWAAQLGGDVNKIFLGRFETPEQAYSAYVEAGGATYGEFFRG